jgi:predicted nucleotidyltransferase
MAFCPADAILIEERRRRIGGIMREKKDVAEDAKESELRMEDVEKIYDFISDLSERFGTFIKAVAVFGSFARRKTKGANDIDIMVIVDDSFGPMDKALFVAFQGEMAKLTREFEKFHVNTVTISQFWDSARRGDPLAIQVLRDGVALVDQGFFAPLKRLLVQGKIKPTEEAINASLSRAFFNINGYNSALLGAANALYWAAVEAAHAGIMRYGRVPGSPWEVSHLLKETLVKDGVLAAEDVKAYEDVFALEKGMSKGDVTHVETEELERLHGRVVKFVTAIDSWVNVEGIKKRLGNDSRE